MRKEIILSNWLFHKGDIEVPKPVEKGPIYTQSKTERKLSGPAAYNYLDSPDPFYPSKHSIVTVGKGLLCLMIMWWLRIYRKTKITHSAICITIMLGIEIISHCLRVVKTRELLCVLTVLRANLQFI